MNYHVGAIAFNIGDVRFENFKVADNLIAGIEVEQNKYTMDGTAQTNGALIIGRSNNANALTKSVNSFGFITPRSENY